MERRDLLLLTWQELISSRLPRWHMQINLANKVVLHVQSITYLCIVYIDERNGSDDMQGVETAVA